MTTVPTVKPSTGSMGVQPEGMLKPFPPSPPMNQRTAPMVNADAHPRYIGLSRMTERWRVIGSIDEAIADALRRVAEVRERGDHFVGVAIAWTGEHGFHFDGEIAYDRDTDRIAQP